MTQQQNLSSTSLVNRLIFSSDVVKTLGSSDFNIDKPDLITLKSNECVLVLFYVENDESYQLANIWGLAAQQTAGPIFAAVNMLNERKVAEAFTKLKSDGNNTLQWAALRQYPFILVYRNGNPVAIYNGEREVQAIIDFALTLACKAGYYEIVQVGGSMEAENRVGMNHYGQYVNLNNQPETVRTSSIQYNSDNIIRGFNVDSTGTNNNTPSIYNSKFSNTSSQQFSDNISLNNTPSPQFFVKQPQTQNTAILPSQYSFGGNLPLPVTD